ncbi:AraC family transcriptional regulator [Reichenbachiella ulvae]|uniref:AraC family transcriptional regulator n=1 Tax=Reichenbachiella ulvae TaxID=2980104 RepID=A0ABT3CUZ3_9BACT|nr:AraC family transcriptional regulator [Reichenbachiella ulvae]MCV9387339.1 AraC family transcriptional regulator [Reichenbachiella ulvae]
MRRATKNENLKRFENRVQAGFLGQRMINIPKKILTTVKKNSLINQLYITDIGFFPHAKHHFRQRKNGCKEHILIYCKEGQGIIEIHNTQVELKANSFYIIPPETRHAYYAVQKDPWSIYWMHFTGPQAYSFFDKLDKDSHDKPRYISFEQRRISIFENLMNVIEDGYSSGNLEFVNITLWQLIGSFVYDSYFSEIGIETAEEDVVARSIKYMKERLNQALKVDEIASYFNYSNSHFFSLFKKKTGYSPIHYFNHLKIQKACQILSFTDLSVKEISFQLGYEDPLYFSRLFKKTMNISPLQYRSEYKH